MLYAIIQTWRGVTYGEAFDMAAGDSLSPAVSYRHDSDAVISRIRHIDRVSRCEIVRRRVSNLEIKPNRAEIAVTFR